MVAQVFYAPARKINTPRIMIGKLYVLLISSGGIGEDFIEGYERGCSEATTSRSRVIRDFFYELRLKTNVIDTTRASRRDSTTIDTGISIYTSS